MNTDSIMVKVENVKDVAPAIREFTLVPLRQPLLPFSPGSHVLVEMPSEPQKFKNAYSLLGDPRDASAYRIAVRLQENSRGGSRYMHESVQVGDQLSISPPANLFAPIWAAKKHILIAGGVGITPFMSYLPEMIRRDADFELHYLYRGQVTGAYASELAKDLGGRYFAYDSSEGVKCNITKLLAERRLGTHFYICGPETLVDYVKNVAVNSGVPDGAIHYEEFAAPQPGVPFEVEIQSTGLVVPVGAEQSMLEALEAANVDVPYLCRGGVCGQCLCHVKNGAVDHRDSFLSEAEKTAGTAIMPCVSRAKDTRLTIEI